MHYVVFFFIGVYMPIFSGEISSIGLLQPVAVTTHETTVATKRIQ